MQTLCIDIGNSNIKAALFENDILLRFDFYNNEESFYESIKSITPSQIAISSVNPRTLKNIQLFIKEFFGTPFIVSRKNKFDLSIEYATPETLGLDRLCAAEGAFYLHKKNGRNFTKNSILLCVDFGTATTINLIKYPGVFFGGAIAPGIKTMFKSLNQNTAQLPEVSESEYIGLIGNSTKSSMASGVINSTVGLIEKFIGEIKIDDKSAEIFLYLTGGNGDVIVQHIKNDFFYNKALVCYGIYSVFKKNN